MITREALKAELESLPGLIQVERGCNRERVEAIHETNSEIRQAYLSKLFGGRDISTHITSDFWVYCPSLEDAERVKVDLRAIGFKNITTFVPKVGAADFESIDDPNPNHAFAVSVSSVDELIIGPTAKKHIEIFGDVLKPLQDSISFIYAHCGHMSIRFSNLKAATTFKAFIDSVYSMNQTLSEKFEKGEVKGGDAFETQSAMKQHNLDTWTVDAQIMIVKEKDFSPM